MRAHDAKWHEQDPGRHGKLIPRPLKLKASSVIMAEINHQMMDSDDENLSVHSAISNPSDFAEDEEVDYLALELLHHLPSEKADKLMKSLRAKEKAVQRSAHISAAAVRSNPATLAARTSSAHILPFKMGCGDSKAKPAEPQAAPKKEPEPVKEEPKPEEKPAEPKAEEQATVAEQVQAAAEKVMAAAAEMVGYGDQTPVAALDLQTGAEVTNIRSGMSGKVLEQKATEALVKYDDGKAEWTEIAALKLTDKPSEVVDDKAAHEIKLEGAGDTKSMCSCGWM
ncbi:hypothetical protein AK812_SmicGene7306 [Symbiodinium microadriaticum]|uniref:Uncharacterized protein n=1 Tax=Symbiodinium microadriaticum TaxID=2951 RepID=A0A1Q9ENY7_SYMMI|nr:hypothetical protein AK812_SmicGene7306 [Symbiodinium microadriaticum]